MVVKSVIVICAFLATVSALFDPKEVRGVQIQNKGQEKLWIQMSGEESFILPPGQMASLVLEGDWSGVIFSRSEECEFQKCNSPFTAAELKFGGRNGKDQYRVSVKNGFNRAVMVKPNNLQEYCKPAGCPVDLNKLCAKNHRVLSDDGIVVACRSPSEAYQKACPNTVTSEQDEEANTFTCKTDTYVISVGTSVKS